MMMLSATQLCLIVERNLLLGLVAEAANWNGSVEVVSVSLTVALEGDDAADTPGRYARYGT